MLIVRSLRQASCLAQADQAKTDEVETPPSAHIKGIRNVRDDALSSTQEKPARYMRLHTGGLYPQIGWRVSGKPELHSQLLAATTTTGSQHAAAVLGGHTGTEAVHLAALTLLGLVGTEHVSTLLTFVYQGIETLYC
jgi:hypothetical protein